MKYIIIFFITLSTCLADGQVNTIDSLELIKIIDQRVDSFKQQFDVPGAVFSMVKDGRLFYETGTGYENIEANKPVDPVRSQFRVASITKTFTSIAILQLVEQGKLDLHADIRTYLPEDEYVWNAPYSFTIHHLLTHTAGMENSGFRICHHATKEKSMKSFVACSVSNQVFKPGEVFMYSNKGFGILGLLIEQMSGMKYVDYVAKNILKPVGMTHSTVYQHTAENPLDNPVQPYYWDGEFKQRQRLPLVNSAASNLNTTGRDMSKFLTMMLDSGSVSGTPIISKSSFELMTTPHFNPNHDYQSMAYGIMIERYRGYTGYNHGGGIDGFGSYYVLFPELQIGLFMSESGGEENAAYTFRVIYDVLDKIVVERDKPEPIAMPLEQATKQADNYAGRYQNTTGTKSTFERGQMLFGINEPLVKHAGNGILSFGGSLYEPIDRDTYRKVDGDRTIGFSSAEGVTYMNEHIFWTFEKINWFESATTLRVSMMLAFVGMLIGLLIRPLRMAKSTGRSLKWASTLSAGSLGLIIGFGLLLIAYAMDIPLTTGTPLLYKIGLWLTTLGALVVCFYPLELARSWKTLNANDRFWTCLNFSAVLLLMICYWRVNLIGFNYY